MKAEASSLVKLSGGNRRNNDMKAEASSLVKLSGGNRRKLGQSFLFTHIAFVAFGIVMIFSIITAFGNLHSDYKNFVVDKEIQQVCFIVKGGIENIYYPSDYRSPTTEVHGSVRLTMPSLLGGEAYRMQFSNNTLVIESGRKMYQCKIGFPANYSGSGSGGLMELKYIRNATRDRIEISSV